MRIDTLKKATTLDPLQRTFAFDNDYTLLATEKIKEHCNVAFAGYDPLFAPDIWLKTYPEAKTRENYYDLHAHLQILASKLKGDQEKNIAKLDQLVDEILEHHLPGLIYPHMHRFLSSFTEQYSFIIVSSGSGDYHRRKFAAMFQGLPALPQIIVHVENMDKGLVFKELIARYGFDTKVMYVFDDNVRELESIYTEIKLPPHLLRVKQPGGRYNDKESKLAAIEEINFITHPGRGMRIRS